MILTEYVDRCILVRRYLTKVTLYKKSCCAICQPSEPDEACDAGGRRSLFFSRLRKGTALWHSKLQSHRMKSQHHITTFNVKHASCMVNTSFFFTLYFVLRATSMLHTMASFNEILHSIAM
jgi:hypothetical protein